MAPHTLISYHHQSSLYGLVHYQLSVVSTSRVCGTRSAPVIAWRTDKMLTTITAVGGLIGLFISTLLLALQTREVAKQTQISNSIAGASALTEAMAALRGSHHQIMFDHPELRPYFYDSKPAPTIVEDAFQLMAAADMLADCLETAMHATRHIPATESYDDWADYSRYLLEHSPVLTELVRQHPVWFPYLVRLLKAQ
jgi:hypothetical protein